MRISNTRKLSGRNIELVAVDTIPKIVKLSKGHSSAHVNLPKKWEGKEVRITLVMPKPFVCKGCKDVITMDENFSEDPKLCFSCLKQKEAVDNDECLVCCGKGAKAGYWGQCEKCFNSDEDVEIFGLYKPEDLEEIKEDDNNGK